MPSSRGSLLSDIDGKAMDSLETSGVCGKFRPFVRFLRPRAQPIHSLERGQHLGSGMFMYPMKNNTGFVGSLDLKYPVMALGILRGVAYGVGRIGSRPRLERGGRP